jgi:hypothetical protein
MQSTKSLKRILKLKNFLRLIFGILCLVALFFVFILFLVVSNIYSFSPPSYISVMNLTDTPLMVNNSVLNIYESYLEETNIKRNFRISDFNNNEIFNKTIPNNSKQTLDIIVYAKNRKCFFSADVTAFYYNIVHDTLINQKVLDDKGSYSISVELELDKYIYLYPGKYSLDNLPNILLDKKILGIYPIECNRIDNEKDRLEVVKFFREFDPNKQQRYFLEEVEPLRDELERKD